MAVLHWAALVVGGVLAFRYFRALGDVTQALFDVERGELIAAVQNERATLITIGVCFAGALCTHVLAGVGNTLALGVALTLMAALTAFPWLWVHVGLRGQQTNARYFDIEAARRVLSDEDGVVVFETEGGAWAFPDREIRRPHIAGTPNAHETETSVMTYCALSRLGIAVCASNSDRSKTFSVVGQHGNNLIMQADKVCVQQIYLGTRFGDADVRRVAVIRMPWRGFRAAYPGGRVYLNPMVPWRTNPLLRLFDEIIERVFASALDTHHRTEQLLFETLRHEDERLARKTPVWGIVVAEEAAAFTLDFVRERGVVNTEVGGLPVVLAYDEQFDALVAFKRPQQIIIQDIDFWGRSEAGVLPRVESLYPGLYWFAWVNFFPHTSLDAPGVGSGTRVLSRQYLSL